MPTCIFCGADFDLSHAKRSIGRSYGAGSYDDYYPEGNVCESCATEEISADYGTGEEIFELNARFQDDDY